MKKTMSIFATLPKNLPKYKRDFIQWLEQFRYTGGLIRNVANMKFNEEEIARLRSKLTGTLTPKKDPS